MIGVCSVLESVSRSGEVSVCPSDLGSLLVNLSVNWVYTVVGGCPVDDLWYGDDSGRYGDDVMLCLRCGCVRVCYWCVVGRCRWWRYGWYV